MSVDTLSSVALKAAVSPHTRGWPDREAGGRWPCPVLPAHAGMARTPARSRASSHKFSPHTRGWPGSRRRGCGQRGRSPRTRGDGPDFTGKNPLYVVRSPRTRGDGPSSRTVSPSLNETFSPHTRGWPARSRRRAGGGRRSPRTRGDGRHRGVRVGRTTHFHRPLSQYISTLRDTGFQIDSLVEPFPSQAIQCLYPEPWSIPRFLALLGYQK